MSSGNDFKALSIAVVEDDELIRKSLVGLLNAHKVQCFVNSEALLASEPAAAPDLVLLDLCSAGDLEGLGSLSRIPAILSHFAQSEVVIQSGITDAALMRACVKAGAARFIMKDHLADEVPLVVARHAAIKTVKADIDRELLGESPVMQRLKRELLALRFESGVDVLVEGETGSGKELCARSLHAGGPFVAVNVSAIPAELFESEFFGAEKGSFTGATQARSGLFESAGAGTLFLDEVQSLSPAHQAKLLRVLETRRFTRVGASQERAFRARVVSAANVNLKEAVAKGQFREDLYFRLAALSVPVPPLRVRGDDILLLARAFLKDFDHAGSKRFSDDAWSLLRGYDWPGNVRELRNLVRSLVIKSPIPILDGASIAEMLGSSEGALEIRPLPDTGDAFDVEWGLGFDENLQRLEKFLLQHTLKKHKSAAAREVLKLARSRFYEKVRQYDLLK